MKKRIFQDLITETRLPVNLWIFFLISIAVHVMLFTFFITVEFPQPDLEIHVKKDSAGQSRPAPVSPSPAVPGLGTNSRPSAGPVPTPPQPVQPATGNHEAISEAAAEAAAKTDAGYNPNPPAYSQDPHEPVDLTRPAPETVYRHPLPNTGLDITGDNYLKLYNKPFLDAGHTPRSPTPIYRPSATMSSYNRVKQYIKKSEIPPSEMVKIEELVNAFQYEYPLPEEGAPFSVTTEIKACPWRPPHLLLHLGIQGKIVEADDALRNRDFVIAKDMKIDLDFDPETIKAYRLIGYAETKPLPGKDPDSRREKGQDLRMGQANTTLYELVPSSFPEKPGQPLPAPKIATIHIGFRIPGNTKKSEVAYDVFLEQEEGEEPSDDFNFSAAVAQFGMLLKNQEFQKIANFQEIMQMAIDALGEDKRGYRAEFIKLLEKYQALQAER